MSVHSSTWNHPDLTDTVSGIRNGDADRREIDQFVALCHRMAVAYLGKKARGGQLDPDFFGLDLEDLAMDCIASLFERDGEGRFVQLQDYFEDKVDPDTPNEVLVSHTRRLIFSKVEQELFELYGEVDHTLSKIIRNLKRAAKGRSDVDLGRRHGDLWLTFPEDGRGEESRPVIPGELLEARITGCLHAHVNAPEILDTVHVILTDQKIYRQAVPISTLARAVRDGLGRMQESSDGEPSGSERLGEGEIWEMIEASVTTVRKEKRNSYVGRGKLREQTYEQYFDTVHDVLVDRFLKSRTDRTFFSHLTDRCDVDREEYLENHRTRLEYLVELTQKQLLELASEQL